MSIRIVKVVETTFLSKKVYYQIQKKFLGLFWIGVGYDIEGTRTDTYRTYADAQMALKLYLPVTTKQHVMWQLNEKENQSRDIC